MVKTDEVLRTLLEMGFGCVSLNGAMFRGGAAPTPAYPRATLRWIAWESIPTRP